MRRFMLCAAFLCAGSVAFAQSGANSVPVPNPTFGFSSPQLAASGTAAPFGTAHSCPGLNSDQTRTNAPADLQHIFHVPCLDVKAHPVLLARIEKPLFLPQQRLWPDAKGEPIPTQWPKARIEQIPTQWPNLKMQSLSGPAKTTP